MTICSAAVILFILSAVTIRGTISTVSKRLTMLSGERKNPRSIQLDNLPLPCEVEASERQLFQESPKAQDTNELHERLTVTEMTMAHWKAVEMFKVRSSVAFVKLTVFVADNVELRSDDSIDRITGCRMGSSYTCHGRDIRSASAKADNTFPPSIVVCCAEFLGGLAVDSIRRSVVCLGGEDQSLHPTVWASIVSVCLVPASVFLLFMMFWITIALFHQIRRPIHYIVQRSLLSLVALWYVTSVPVIKTTLSIVLCINAYNTLDATGENSGEIVNATEGVMVSYWAVDTSLKCFEGDHMMLVILIITFVGIVYGGLLIAFIVILGFSEEQLKDTDDWIYQTMGFLYRSYRDGRRRYWEVAIVARKAGIAFLVFCSHRFDSSLPIIGAALFLALAMGAQTVAMPYQQSFDELNRIDIFSLFVSLLTTLLATTLKSESLTIDAGRLAISVLCVFLNITTLTVLLSFLFCYFVAYVRLSLSESETIVDSDARTLHVLRIWLLFKIRSVAEFLGFSKFDDLSSICSGI